MYDEEERNEYSLCQETCSQENGFLILRKLVLFHIRRKMNVQKGTKYVTGLALILKLLVY